MNEHTQAYMFEVVKKFPAAIFLIKMTKDDVNKMLKKKNFARYLFFFTLSLEIKEF